VLFGLVSLKVCLMGKFASLVNISYLRRRISLLSYVLENADLESKILRENCINSLILL
jgi:hypothetical protein